MVTFRGPLQCLLDGVATATVDLDNRNARLLLCVDRFAEAAGVDVANVNDFGLGRGVVNWCSFCTLPASFKLPCSLCFVNFLEYNKLLNTLNRILVD